MKARTWFFALGQSHEARRMPYALCVASLKLNALPHWAKQAYTAGRLSVQFAGFGHKVSRMVRALAIPHALLLKAERAPEVTRREMLANIAAGPLSTIQDLQARLRHYDPEATASLGAEVNSVDVLTTLHPHAVQDMVPLGVKVNQRYRGSVPMVVVTMHVPGDKGATKSGQVHGVVEKSEGVQ